MSRLKTYCSALILLIIWQTNIYAQRKPLEISMIDTLGYTSLNTNHIPDARYAISNLVDGRLNTCWVSRLDADLNEASAFIELPKHLQQSPVLTIYSGYWKSSRLYKQNARPKRIKINAFYGFVADGFVSENGYMAFSYQLPGEIIIDLADSMQVQRFELTNLIATNSFLDSLQQHFIEAMGMPVLTPVKLLRLEIIDAYEGSRYPDICISELYFNDCFVVDAPDKQVELTNVYLDEAENTILVDSDVAIAKPIYEDKQAIIQLLQTSSNRHWAIIIKMPASVEGRAETTYEIIDLFRGKSITHELIEQFPDLHPGTEMYLEEEHDQAYLLQWRNDQEIRIALREIY